MLVVWDRVGGGLLLLDEDQADEDLEASGHPGAEEGLGQALFVGSSGRVFPTAMKASPLLRAWLKRLGDLAVAFHAGHDWRGWDRDGALKFATAAGAADNADYADLLPPSWASIQVGPPTAKTTVPKSV